MQSFNVAIVGATGAVGLELLRLLEQRNFPVRDLTLLASSRSAGKTLIFRGEPIVVSPVDTADWSRIDFAFFSAGSSVSKEFIPLALKQDVYVIDNSSAFRMDSDVPLIVPEINFFPQNSSDHLIANPNCTAALLVMTLAPLRNLGQLSRVIVSTYQSASGAGAQAMQELRDQSAEVLAGRAAVPRVLPHPYAFNLFSHNTPIDDAGRNDEEVKVAQETRRILGMPDLGINVTCVRVPVFRAHSESVTVEFAGERPSLDSVRSAWNSFPGVRVVDDRANNHFPMPLEATGVDEVLVGRLREDLSHPQCLSYFLAGDQLLKGAALNAIQIAERLVEKTA